MPNNFKLRGDYYVSKAGSDSNDGLTPDTPKRTVQAGLNLLVSGTRTLIIGAGVYSENLSKTFSLNNSIIADGEVIIESPSATGTIFFQPSSAFTHSVLGITFKNFQIFELRFGSGPYTFTSCKFINCYFLGTNAGGVFGYTFNRCVIVGCTSNSAYTVSGLSFTNSIIINSQIQWLPTNITNCYINNSSVIYTNSAMAAANFNYNNIQGTTIMNVASSVTSGVIQDTYGRYYDLSIATSTGDGSIGNPYGRPYTSGAGFNFANHRIAYPTFNANSFSKDPFFNNVLKQDFSLQSGSFMVGRANNFIDNIGGTYVATRVDASGSSFSGSNATVQTLILNYSDYIISGSALSGSVTSSPIFVSSSAKVIQEIDYNGLLAFNKDTTAPTGSNVNVPDVLTYTSASGQPGANPDRLTYYMRWTTGSSQPVSDANWENGGLWPAGSFNIFEWNTKPSVDFLGRGNGDQDFNIVNTPTFVKATWIQLRVTLRNNYLI